MNHPLQDALREAAEALAGSDPRELDPAERQLYELIDDRMFEIMDRLIAEHDEAGPAARAAIVRAMRR